MKYVLIAVFLAGFNKILAQSFGDSLAFYYRAGSSEGLKEYIDREQNVLSLQGLSVDNDTTVIVHTIWRTLLHKYYENFVDDASANKDCASQESGRYLLTNDSLQIVFARSLDTHEVVTSLINKYNTKKNKNLKFDLPYSAVAIENFYHPDSLKIGQNHYKVSHSEVINGRNVLPVNQYFIDRVNYFLNEDLEFHNEKVTFLAAMFQLHPTYFKNSWECRYNVYIKKITFDILMQNAIAEFRLKKIGGAARFTRENDEWVLTDIKRIYYVD